MGDRLLSFALLTAGVVVCLATAGVARTQVQDQAPASVVVLLDTGPDATMSRGELDNMARQAIRELAPGHSLVLGAFGSDLRFSNSFSDDPRMLLGLLDQLPFGERTRLYDGLVEAVEQLSARDGTRAVLIVSAGSDDGSSSSLSDVVDRSQEAQVTLHVIDLAGARRSGSEVRRLAEETSGSYHVRDRVDRRAYRGQQLYSDRTIVSRAIDHIVPREARRASRIRALRSTLARHRAQWESLGLQDYVFTYSFQNTWGFPPTYAIRVESGTPARLWASAQEQAWGDAGHLEERELMTIDDLFDRLDTALENGAADSAIIYDFRFGHPVSGGVNWPDIIDEEYSFSVTLVRPVGAIQLVERAEGGDVQAQYRLGQAYTQGDGVPRDAEAGRRLIRLAAEAGHPGAQTSVAAAYLNGWDVPEDEAEAIRWYRRAASHDDGYADYVLGGFYEEGRAGLGRDLDLAVRHYLRSAARGNRNGQRALGRMYRDGRGVERDVAEAERLLELAARQGDILAERYLSELPGVR